jgi:hypothetical protein
MGSPRFCPRAFRLTGVTGANAYFLAAGLTVIHEPGQPNAPADFSSRGVWRHRQLCQPVIRPVKFGLPIPMASS